VERVIVRKKQTIGFLFILPYATIMITLIVFPIIYNVGLSFRDIRIGEIKGHFVGLQQYVNIIQSIDFQKSFVRTMIWTICSIVPQIMIGLGVALLMNQKLRGRNILRALFTTPYVLPVAVTALTWIWLYDPYSGIINYFLQRTGVIRGRMQFLGSIRYAFPAVVIANIWRGFPFAMVMFLARLQAISSDLYEAAKIDGASLWQRFTYITFPLLAPVITIILFFRFIWTFNYFDLVYIMTKGGPATATEILPVTVYMTAFPTRQLSKGAALATLMALFLMILFFFYYWFYWRRREAA